MIRKKDIMLIVGLLLMAGAIYAVMTLVRGGQTVSGRVDIYAANELYATASLDTPQDITVTQPDGALNIVRIRDGSVEMIFSSCKNQLCLHQGAVSAENWTRRSMGRSIVCLPNSVLVELALEEDHPSMQDWDLPDA